MVVEANEIEIARAAAIIRRGGLVAFPTETVYGLGANALDEAAVARIYAAKERPSASPLIVHVADVAMARTMVTEWPALAQKLSAQFWPGPLTIILKKAPNLPSIVTAGLDSVGIRIPNHRVALSLISIAGVPIAAPSANRFTEISPTTAEHVSRALGDKVDVVLDGGPARVGIESTVVSLRRDPPIVLRPGMISHSDLERATHVRWEVELDKPHIAESPGLHPKHYAPRTRFYILEQGTRPSEGRGKIIEMPMHIEEYAAQLYAELHKADSEGWDWIAVFKPPNTDEWVGIQDRLRRASFRE